MSRMYNTLVTPYEYFPPRFALSVKVENWPRCLMNEQNAVNDDVTYASSSNKS